MRPGHNRAKMPRFQGIQMKDWRAHAAGRHAARHAATGLWSNPWISILFVAAVCAACVVLLLLCKKQWFVLANPTKDCDEVYQLRVARAQADES